jgi:hypothetical protein
MIMRQNCEMKKSQIKIGKYRNGENVMLVIKIERNIW